MSSSHSDPSLLAGCARSRFENSFKMLPHSYGAVGFSTSNFFEVPCSIQKVVKFKGRINVQLPLWAAAALEADSRTVLRCWTIIVWNCWTVIESSAASETKLGRRQMMLPHSYGAGGFSTSNFFEVPCSIQKVVRFKGRINVQLPLWLLAGCTRSRFEKSFNIISRS